MSLEQKINNLETDLHIMGTLVLDSLVSAVRALEDKDTLKASEVMDKDDEIDDAYTVSYTHLTLPTTVSV